MKRRFPADLGVGTGLAILAGLIVAGAVAGGVPPAACAQQTRESRAVPRENYFMSFGPYYAGEYKTALRAFRDAARTGVRSSEGRWIDSICYHAMIAECYYHMGDLAAALEQHESALKLFLAHKDWMLRVQFPQTVSPSSSSVRSTIKSAPSRRRAKLGHFPATMLSYQGRLNNEQVLRQGGVVMPPQLFSVRVQEIVRCTALSLRRRRELLGPACVHDPLTAQLLAVLLSRPSPPNHWSQAWVDVQLGLAYASAGKTAEAVNQLQRSLLVAGEFDHPLTGVALLELGKLALEQDRLDAAASFFLEATLAGAEFGQADVVEEAFRHGLVTHLIANRPGMYAPLQRAVPWAKSRGLDRLQAALQLLAAENAAAGQQTAVAKRLLEEAQRVMRRRDMSSGDIGAAWQFTLAQVGFQDGNVRGATAALASAISFQKTGARRLFQISLVDRLLTAGTISPRVANLLFAEVLREPTARDWTRDPLETLAVVVTPHPLPWEHWFEIALERKETDRALEIADRLRRHRFYTALPLGGRLLSLRWILEAPDQALTDVALLERQDLLAKYPKLAALTRQSAGLRQALQGIPPIPTSQEDGQQQRAVLTELERVAAQQEMLLHEIALRREPSEFVFPPLRTTAQVRAAMSPGQTILAFHCTSRAVYGLLVRKDDDVQVSVAESAGVNRFAVAILRGMGNHDRNHLMTASQLNENAWETPARQLMQLLTGKLKPDTLEKTDEWIVVPSGSLWYVPFETLPVLDGRTTSPLISKTRIRYVPTVGLAVGDARGRLPEGRTAVILGKLFPRDDPQLASDAMDQLRRVLPDAAAVPSPPTVSSRLLRFGWNRLLALDDVEDADGGAFLWSPAQIDRGKPGSRLQDWFPLPWGGPDQIVLPAFHTAAENGLKQRANGDDLFLAVCGMMSTGTRTILLSRWRPGGQTSYDLVREFVQELPYDTAASAWQRSVQLAMQAEIDPQREPRVQPSAGAQPMRADHPFFWSAYLLVDTGSQPASDGQDAAAPGAQP